MSDADAKSQRFDAKLNVCFFGRVNIDESVAFFPSLDCNWNAITMPNGNEVFYLRSICAYSRWTLDNSVVFAQ